VHLATAFFFLLSFVYFVDKFLSDLVHETHERRNKKRNGAKN